MENSTPYLAPLRRPARVSFDGALAVLLACFVVVLCAASIALLGRLGAVLWFCILAGCLGLLFLAIHPDAARDGIFAVAVGTFFLIPLVHKTTGIALNGYWQIFVVACALVGLPGFIREVWKSKLLALALVFFLGVLVLGLLSSYFGRSRFMAAFYQFVSNLKPLLLLALGFAMAWRTWAEKTLWGVVRWFWLFALVFVVFQWVAPGAYNQVFPHPGIAGADGDRGLLPSRAMGPFIHPSFLGTIAAFFALMCAIRALLYERVNAKFLCLTVAYLALLASSGNRQEIAACVVTLAFALVLTKPGRFFQRSMIAAVVVVVGGIAFWAAFSDSIIQEAAWWGFNSINSVERPRAQILYAALLVASWYFPLGAGLGTFGGAGSQKFDVSLYYELGFANYWWFGKQDFLMDTYWPNSLAETGYFGALLLVLFYAAILLYAALRSIKASKDARLYWIAAAVGMAYMLALSLTSPGFQDPRLFLFPALMFGLAARRDQPQHDVRAKPRLSALYPPEKVPTGASA